MAYKVQKAPVVRDRIYGDLVIDQPVIAELIQSQPMQRLKHISQDGAPHFIQPLRNVTRYEHCIGAWYLSQRYNRPIEEQIASLLHDVPHTAFSHVIDVIMDDVDNGYHDKFLNGVVLNSEIPDICARHGIAIDDVLDTERYPLLENSLPDISVDRWDYFMRDGYAFGLLPEQLVSLFLASVKEKQQQFYFEDLRVASLSAAMFMQCCRLIWLDPTSHGSFYLLAQVLKTAWDDGVIMHDDFFQTDAYVLGKLHAASTPKLHALLDRLQPGREFRYVSEAEAEFYGPNKPRVVDPLVEQDGELVRLSQLVPGLGDYLDEFKSRYRYIGVMQQR